MLRLDERPLSSIKTITYTIRNFRRALQSPSMHYARCGRLMSIPNQPRHLVYIPVIVLSRNLAPFDSVYRDDKKRFTGIRNTEPITRDGSNMLIDERRQHMLAKIQRDGRVLVSELSDALGISRITIRKDLGYPKSKGKRHGVLARCRLPRATRS
jgi:hypothetical protein